jgi:hypothetical protein
MTTLSGSCGSLFLIAQRLYHQTCSAIQWLCTPSQRTSSLLASNTNLRGPGSRKVTLVCMRRWQRWQSAARFQRSKFHLLPSRWCTVKTFGGGPCGTVHRSQRHPASSFTCLATSGQLGGYSPVSAPSASFHSASFARLKQPHISRIGRVYVYRSSS